MGHTDKANNLRVSANSHWPMLLLIEWGCHFLLKAQMLS
jgi:hypothetical protein